jgi:hypothetical protein
LIADYPSGLAAHLLSAVSAARIRCCGNEFILTAENLSKS